MFYLEKCRQPFLAPFLLDPFPLRSKIFDGQKILTRVKKISIFACNHWPEALKLEPSS
jgi:hypothetical protein